MRSSWGAVKTNKSAPQARQSSAPPCPPSSRRTPLASCSPPGSRASVRSTPSGSPCPEQSRQQQQGELTPTDQWKIPLQGLPGGAVPAAAAEQQGSLVRHLASRSPTGQAPCRAEVAGPCSTALVPGKNLLGTRFSRLGSPWQCIWSLSG